MKNKWIYLSILFLLIIVVIIIIHPEVSSNTEKVVLMENLQPNNNSFILLPLITVILISLVIVINVRVFYDKVAAERADKAKTKFLAEVSHEIRTPLNAIIGYSNLLKTADEDKIQVYTSRINHSASILLDLINDVLDISKITDDSIVLDYNDFDLSYELDLLIDSFTAFAKEKGIDLIVDEGDCFKHNLKGDVLRVKQILTNLIGNAIKFTSEGYVKLTVNCEHLKKNKVNIFFEVNDTGIGIEKEKISNVFIPFEQLNTTITKEYGGSGLGLSIAKKLINEMGGDITVESTFGEGTTFKFNIILDISDDQTNISSLDKEVTLNTKDKKVLIVEDNLVNSVLIVELLKSKGLNNITTAEHGEEAIDILKDNKFDIILMDIQMPVMDGLTAVKIIKESYNDKYKKIIALTANVLKEQIDEYLSAGFDDYISKPINIYNLINKIND